MDKNVHYYCVWFRGRSYHMLQKVHTSHTKTHSPRWRRLVLPTLCIRLVVLSPAWKTARRDEFGLLTFTTCMFSLKLPRPLSPPIFMQTSEEGIVLSCPVRPLADLSCKYQGIVLLKTWFLLQVLVQSVWDSSYQVWDIDERRFVYLRSPSFSRES